MITTRKATRALRAMMPTWLLAVFAVCLIIPGPFDEAAALTVALLLGIAQPVRFRRAASAWRGGKTRRTQPDLRVVAMREYPELRPAKGI